MKKRIILLTVCFLAVCGAASSTLVYGQGAGSGETYTVIVSLDGFRWDYPLIYDTPNLDRMARRGVSATMRPSYPSSTFPNHYTLVTGLVPDHHGIINNTFWDRTTHLQFSLADTLTRNDPRYWGGEPIWITAERQGVTAGSLYWPGSDIRGRRPTYFKEWADEPRLDFAERVDTALAWLSLPETERPRLITLYIEEPDGSGHRYGPTGEETRLTVERLDSLVGVLAGGIEKLPFADRVNLIVTSDHGMTDISPSRFVDAGALLRPEWYHHAVGSNPTSIFCSLGYCDSIVGALSGVRGIRVYRKGEIPPSLDYGTNENVGDLVVVADPGWQFGESPSTARGAHGYDPFGPDPASADMHVIFFATGPDFRRNFRGETFDNTAIYSLLARLLDIAPAPTDGDETQITQFLSE